MGTAVQRVVAIVAHDEEALGRDDELRRVVGHTVVGILQHRVAAAVGQRLLIERAFLIIAAACLVVANERALRRLAVDDEHAVGHLDTIARQADDALYIVGPVGALALVTGVFEDRDIAALGYVAQDTSGKKAE